MGEIVIRVTRAGAQCLWTDALDLRFLGRAAAVRVSEVEFSPSRQAWEAREVGTGRLLARCRQRSQAVAGEVRHFNRRVRLARRPWGGRANAGKK